MRIEEDRWLDPAPAESSKTEVLSSADVHRWRESGYAIVDGVFEEERLSGVRESATRRFQFWDRRSPTCRPDEFVERLIAGASLDQRAVLGFPQPGSSDWNADTIDAIEARYGVFGFDATP